MPSIHKLPAEERAEMVARLKRIEGQAKGIQKMIDGGRDCVEVLTQLAALKAATASLSAQLLEDFALYCLRHPTEFASPEDAVRQVVRVMVRAG